MSNPPSFETIVSDEFRIELRTVEDGPLLVLSGRSHDPELILTVLGVECPDEDREQAQITLTTQHLTELVARVVSMRPGSPGICRGCGCTDAHACEGGCGWVDAEHTICSSCAPPEAPKKRARKGGRRR